MICALGLTMAMAMGGSPQPDSTLVFGSEQERFDQAAVLYQSGAHELRILSPTVLEVFVVSEQDGATGTPTYFDWIDETVSPPLTNSDFPLAADLSVLVNGTAAGISDLSLIRNVFYAPLTDPGQTFPVRLGNSLFIELGSPLPTGAVVEVQNPAGDKWPTSFQFLSTFDDARWNPSIHVNQVGYTADNDTGKGKNLAYLGRWLGELGDMDITATTFEIVPVGGGAAAYSGTLVQNPDVGFLESPTPYQDVYVADFTPLTTPGEYQVRIPGYGESYPFTIGDGVDGVYARTLFAGLYHQRTGSAAQGADQKKPFTRYEDGPDHTASAEIPLATNPFLYDNGLIKDESNNAVDLYSDVLPEFQFDQALGSTIDVSGGHMDAGDYSKYTHNSALTIHSLMFGVDSVKDSAGNQIIKELDNLCLPESGDGVSDMLQEAVYEADFLVKMQDTDGGFYNAVLPKTRRFEADVLPADSTDTQIVLPKSAIATAAAVAALAEIGSSPCLIAEDAAKAQVYRDAAVAGWDFLADDAQVFAPNPANPSDFIIDGSKSQVIFHYGEAFGLNDEMAWAAAAMFAAFGNGGGGVTTSLSDYETYLSQWFERPDISPDGPETEIEKDKWIFQKWRCLYEGFGAAARAYVFAECSGRRTAADYANTSYQNLAKSGIVGAGDKIVERTNESAYGVAFPSKAKEGLNANQFFPLTQAFDALAAYICNPTDDYLCAIRQNLDFVGGANAANQPFLTGIGWERQREIISQYAENDLAELPPIGIPLGALQSGPDFIPRDIYKTTTGGNLLQQLVYPKGDPTAGTGTVFGFYDRYSDQYSLRQEFVIPKMARDAVVSAFLFACSPASSGAWGASEINAATVTIDGLPAIVDDTTTVSLSSNVDLTGARITWDGQGLEPCHGDTFTFSPVLAGQDRPLWADILLPDGCRLYACATYDSQPPSTKQIEDFQPMPADCNPNVIAWYQLDGNAANAVQPDPSAPDFANYPGDVTISSEGTYDGTSFSWANRPNGQALRVDATSTAAVASVSIPNTCFDLAGGAAAITSEGVCVEAMFYIEDYVGGGTFMRVENGNSRNLQWQYLNLQQGSTTKWGGGSNWLTNDEMGAAVTQNEWFHVRLELIRTGTNAGQFRAFVDGVEVADANTGNTFVANFEPGQWAGTGNVNLTFGNFIGWIDEVIVTSIKEPIDYSDPVVTLNGPANDTVKQGQTYNDPGATGTDYTGATLTPNVIGVVDTATPGVYTLVYSVVDECGTEATVSRTVTVTAYEVPVLVVNGDNPVSFKQGQSFTDPGATATDFEGNTLSVTVSGSVDPNTAGTYTLTYTSAADSCGNVGSGTRTVVVTPYSLPTLTVLGNASETVKQGFAYSDAGATAVDFAGVPLLVTTTGTVNVSVPGTYTLTYTSEPDVCENVATGSRTVVVDAYALPQLSINGVNPESVKQGESYSDAGAVASDFQGNSLAVAVTGSVDASTPGTYTLTYTSAVDSCGNAATGTRTVVVNAYSLPTITLNGANPLTIAEGSTFTDPGAVASDFAGNNLAVTTSGTVNTAVPGTYTLTYTSAPDSCENVATVSRTVLVTEDSDPPDPATGTKGAGGNKVAGYSFENGTLAESSGQQVDLNLSGNAAVNSTDGVIEFSAVGDEAKVVIPLDQVYDPKNTTGICLSARIKLNQTLPIACDMLSLTHNWKANMRLLKTWGVVDPEVRAGQNNTIVPRSDMTGFTIGEWHDFKICLDLTGYTVTLDGVVVGTAAAPSDLGDWDSSPGKPVTLKFGNFDGCMDDICVTSIRPPSFSGSPAVEFTFQSDLNEDHGLATTVSGGTDQNGVIKFNGIGDKAVTQIDNELVYSPGTTEICLEAKILF
ncbi:MAG: immunoglobulin-like domain-containing protein, partial [Verrucomicrobiota bacterium]